MPSFAQYCEDEPFVVESGEVTTPDGKVLNYPTLHYRKEVVEKDKVNSLVGKPTQKLSPTNISVLFNRDTVNQVSPG